MTVDEFVLECKKICIDINEEIVNKLLSYYQLLKEWNSRINLTRVIEQKDVMLKHYYDSLCITRVVEIKNQTICDFGSGAGFPGMVIAIVFPSSNVTLVESSGKKCAFLEDVRKNLNLKNVIIVNERIEIFGKHNREKYDIVTCRAVSKLSIIIELAAALIKVNGLFVPLKSHIDEELEEAKVILNNLDLKVVDIKEYYLPIENSKRTILSIIKKSYTGKKYPRNYNIILKDNK